jgi:hypothetical protein
MKGRNQTDIHPMLYFFTIKVEHNNRLLRCKAKTSMTRVLYILINIVNDKKTDRNHWFVKCQANSINISELFDYIIARHRTQHDWMSRWRKIVIIQFLMWEITHIKNYKI